MSLVDLTVQNFRSYTQTSFTFDANINLIVGANAVGKTNILEAVTLLSTGKSFRAGTDREMIRWSESVARIDAHTSDGTELKIQLTGGEEADKRTPLKRFFVNGVARRSLDFVGYVPSTLFWPEDLDIVTGSPSIRRRFLDMVLTQTDREYRRNLVSYERGVRQRNRVLEAINSGRAQRSQLLFWDQLLISAGQYITDARAAFLSYVNTFPMSDHAFLAEYDKSVISPARLEQYAQEEVAAKSTLVGPHRDDMHILSKNHGASTSGEFRDIAKYGSRGEQRLAVLWVKLAQMAFIETNVGQRPVLLLDDIFSELDSEHRNLVASIASLQQTFITSADMSDIPDSIQRVATQIHI